METKAWERTCDNCGQKYIMNKVDIPRIFIVKTIAVSDIEFKDYIASPDLCMYCVIITQRTIERKNKLRYSVNGNRIIQSLGKLMYNQSI